MLHQALKSSQNETIKPYVNREFLAITNGLNALKLKSDKNQLTGGGKSIMR